MFVEPVTRRNRVWQADFCEFETGAEGTWRLGGVTDYAAKVVLGCTITATSTASDLIAVFDTAIATAQTLLGKPLIEDCVDPDTGELCPVVAVTDNGPAMTSIAVASWFESHPELIHIGTRHRSPHTNGVIERWFQPLKYERLYRHEIATVIELADHVSDYIDEYNTTRPHESLDWQRPLEVYLKKPTPKPHPPKSEQES